ncbi:hypothetical protein [Acetobacter senegalensis]|uniref:hypothetical protein n=1 Tax=Acetobacter senegalensis TaxID=446692 RepID=UPI00264D5E3D|nr:hypothetical protein [Acetobacter senegalensis]MDN7355539.1 hypothetical protein [Acetobacter senegalensis]
MTSHNPTRTPAAPACQPDVVRGAANGSSRLNRMLYLVRLHVVRGAVRAFHIASVGLRRVGRLPPMAWLLTPYAQWKRERDAEKWQFALDGTWPEFYEKNERARAENPWLPLISENPPQVCKSLLKGSSR